MIVGDRNKWDIEPNRSTGSATQDILTVAAVECNTKEEYLKRKPQKDGIKLNKLKGEIWSGAK